MTSRDITEQILDRILGHEGGRTNHVADRGGLTNYGITRPVLAEWLEVEPDAVPDAMLDNLTAEDARRIYRDLFIEGPRFDEIRDAATRHLVVDMAVNHGRGRAGRMLQKAVNVVRGCSLKCDGIVGPKTLSQVNGQAAGAAALYRKLTADRVRLYGRIIAADARKLWREAPALERDDPAAADRKAAGAVRRRLVQPRRRFRRGKVFLTTTGDTIMKLLLQAAFAAFFIVALSGCDTLQGIVDTRGVQLGQETLQTAEDTICRYAPVGSVVRRYGTDRDKADAWVRLCLASAADGSALVDAIDGAADPPGP